ncbi:nuclear transport factor 2 family protein [Herbaspirillum sp. RV1423]|uniref:nuclear transport factor 2 family protein n=1 Tax=Herbaspirillum sp. RV1423 TaxID=1443993 RepID=UPI0004B09EC0|nr:nuclear transport factor 2 family protein [Herbaspirillum sp. RV1423]
MMNMEQRLAALEAAEAIRQLKARYASLADQKYTASYQRQPAVRMHKIARAQAACFTEDAVWEGGAEFGSSLVGREALAEWFNRSPWCYALHYYGSPEITVDGDSASAHWRLWQVALREETKQAVLLGALTYEEYARQQDGNWLCSRMRFDQTQMLPMAGGPFPLVTSFEQINDAARRASLPINQASTS